MSIDKKLNDKGIEEVNGGETDRPGMLKIMLYCKHCHKKMEMESLNIDHEYKNVYFIDYALRSINMYVQTDIFTCKTCGGKTEWFRNRYLEGTKLVLPPE